MNILMLLLVSLATYPAVTCDQVATKTQELQSLVAAGQDVDRVISTGVSFWRNPGPAPFPGSDAHGEVDALLFYVSSHAQALSENAGPTPTSWIALRPMGDVRQPVFFGATDPARTPADDGAKKCSWAVDSADLSERSLLPSAALSSAHFKAC